MARVAVVHWKDEERAERLGWVDEAGHQAIRMPVEETPILRALRGDPPDVVVISLERAPSAGRELGRRIRQSPKTRVVPLLFVGGGAKAMAVGAVFPDAVLRDDWSDIGDGLAEALAVDRSAIGAPSARPVTPGWKKLGVQEGMGVAVVGLDLAAASAAIGALPARARLVEAVAGAGLVVVFLSGVERLDQTLRRATAEGWPHWWAAWGKQAGPRAGALGEGDIRRAAVAAGWVDYKVVAIDDAWAGLKLAPVQGPGS